MKRGATLVEYIVAISMVLGAIVGGVVAFRNAVSSSADCQAAAVATLGAKSCGGGTASGGDLTGESRAQLLENEAKPGGMVCTARGCTGGNCFAAGTLVPTKTGLRPIETIAEGDEVLSADADSLETGFHPVAKVVVTPDKAVLDLRIRRGEREETLRMTPNHALYVEGRGFVEAGMLHEGDVLHNDHEEKVVVVGTSAVAVRTTVYNLEVAKLHTYFVGRSSVLGHYACERMEPSERLRADARTGTLWSKKRFDAVNKLAQCTGFTDADYALLEEAANGEDAAKAGYLAQMKEEGKYETEEQRAAVDASLARPWFDLPRETLAFRQNREK